MTARFCIARLWCYDLRRFAAAVSCRQAECARHQLVHISRYIRSMLWVKFSSLVNGDWIIRVRRPSLIECSLVRSLDTLRRKQMQCAGKFTHSIGKLTLTLSANTSVKNELLHYLTELDKAA